MCRDLRLSCVLLSSLYLLVACGPSQQTKRPNSGEPTDDSFRWNETDSKTVVDSMTEDMLRSQWIRR